MAQLDIVEVAARLVLKDVHRFANDAERARFAVDRLGRAGRGLYGSLGGVATSAVGTLATGLERLSILGGMAAAGLGFFGLKFAGQIEQVDVAFTTMLHSADASKQMIKDLQHFAVTTPFNFLDLVVDARRLMAYGFTQSQVIPMLTNIGDAAAGLGLGAEGIQRITIALGQMQAKARVQSQELLQLTEAGVPAIKILADAMGMSERRLLSVVEQGRVSAAFAIPAILAGMDKQFHGLMEKQSHTLFGLLSNLKDYSQQALAGAAAPFLPYIEKGLGRLNLALPRLRDRWIGYIHGLLSRGQQEFHGMSIGDMFDLARNDPGEFGRRLDKVIGSGNVFHDVLRRLVPILNSLWDIFRNSLLPVLDTAWHVALPLLNDALRLLTSTLQFLADHSTIAKVVIVGLATAFALFTVLLWAANVAVTVAGVVIAFQALAEAAAAAGAWFLGTTIGVMTGLVWLSVAAWIASAAAEVAALWPIYLIVAAVALLVVGLIEAYRHVGWFHDAVDAVANFFVHTDWIGVLKAFVDAFIWAINLVIGAWNSIDFSISVPGIPYTKFKGFSTGDLFPDIPTIPMLAQGGTATRSGRVIVGEAGPEMLDMPQGASVIPLRRTLSQSALAGFADGGPRQPVVVQVMLDRRVLASAMVEDLNSREARR